MSDASAEHHAPPKLYHTLAEWFHLLTAPAEYAEEAAFYTKHLRDACGSLMYRRECSS